MLRRALLIALLLAGLAACGNPNPILDVWVIDTEETSAGAQAAAGLQGIERIEFREDKLVVGSKSVTVAYEIDGERVIVTEAEAGEGEVYTLVGEDRLQKQMPMGLVVVYRREGAATPPVAAGAEAQP